MEEAVEPKAQLSVSLPSSITFLHYLCWMPEKPGALNHYLWLLWQKGEV